MTLTSKDLPNSGQTIHYRFQYDDSLQGGLEPARTKEVVDACERDFDQLSKWFRDIELDVITPIPVNVTQNDGGAGWSLSGKDLTITIKPGGGDSTLIRYLLVSEMVEQFMRAQQRGWFGSDTEGSEGEGLSRFLAAQFLATNSLGDTPDGYSNSNVWLAGARADFVNHISGSDDGPDEVTGCSLLFIYYLFSQLGFTVEAIVAAGAPTLGGVYRNLTGDTADPFPAFKNLIDTYFPGTSTITGGNLDNPFPLRALRSTATALSTGPGETSLYVTGLPTADDGAGNHGSQVWTKFFPDPNRPGQWTDWFALGPNVFPPSSTVTALSTGPGETSLYVMGLPTADDHAGNHGSQVWTKFFPDPNRPGQWTDWLALGPNVFPPG
ncbi:hypothetical protein I6A60_21930 [Frankia sp. AgB1.9]|uniref:hypothetical protein n=1 Tax=unclassified Frankia TaxID=2632575 RepID=UPI00193179B0|nr:MULTISPECIES: hypothetical protein [unclassified Frankia]MBL7487680.1 hypothetical protein [Frankia sp. AgW1.1]MBL7550511.1 hypothetical protein [Frankia sp. AgB1.9]MBL7623773.1 hypothetical protein [Frankia sp. AgB1.8]